MVTNQKGSVMKTKSVKNERIDRKIYNTLKEVEKNKIFMSSESMKSLKKASSDFNKMVMDGIIQKRGNNLMTREDFLSLNFYH